MASDTFRSITIEGFRSIRSIRELYLRPINILIGANGSGKSNFLEAFHFLSEIEEGRKDLYVAQNGGAEKLLFFGSRTTQKIYVLLEASNGHNLTASNVFTGNDELAGVLTWGGLELNGPSFVRYQFHDTGLHSSIKKTNQVDDNRFLRADAGNLAAFLYRLKRQFPGSYELIRKTIQQAAPFFDDFELAPLALNPNTIKIEWRHAGSDGYFDVSSLSDGTLRFMALATLFLQPIELRPSAILIDEPELGLHPFAIGLLGSMIREASQETQVIAATQSPLLLDYFGPEDILVADRVNGATEIQRRDREGLRGWLDDYSLGQLWEKGELAGRPVKE